MVLSSTNYINVSTDYLVSSRMVRPASKYLCLLYKGKLKRKLGMFYKGLANLQLICSNLLLKKEKMFPSSSPVTLFFSLSLTMLTTWGYIEWTFSGASSPPPIYSFSINKVCDKQLRAAIHKSKALEILENWFLWVFPCDNFQKTLIDDICLLELYFPKGLCKTRIKLTKNRFNLLKW